MKTLKNKIAEIRKKWKQDFVPSSLKWKDAVHCTCCSTKSEYKEIEKFFFSSIQEVVTATEEPFLKWFRDFSFECSQKGILLPKELKDTKEVLDCILKGYNDIIVNEIVLATRAGEKNKSTH